MSAPVNDREATQVVVVNRFTIRPGDFDEFVETQLSVLARVRGRIPGWRGSRFYRSLQSGDSGREAVMVSVFDSAADYERWRDSELLAEHRQRIAPLVERAEPGLYELEYEAGEV